MAEAKIAVRLQPGASRDEIAGYAGGVLKVKVTAPPVEGKANAALIRFLADRLDVPKSRVSIVKGAISRSKVVAVEGMTTDDALARLGFGKLL